MQRVYFSLFFKGKQHAARRMPIYTRGDTVSYFASGWIPCRGGCHAAPLAHTLPAAATRGSARRSAAASVSPYPAIALSSGVSPACSRMQGCGAGSKVTESPLRAPHVVLCKRVDPRG